MEKKEYIFEYDLMRIIFMLMTLSVHIIAYTVERNELYNVLDNFFILCNPLFLMLSGRLNLPKEFNKKEDYILYYKNKFKSIIIPLIIVSVIIQLIKNGNMNGFYFDFITNNIEHTYWFIYTLIGILILSPFYSKMLQNMKNFEKKMLLIICIVINFLSMCHDFFGVNAVFQMGIGEMLGWHFYYFSGYIIEDLFKAKKNRKILYFLGILSFIIINLVNNYIVYYYEFKNPGIFLTFQAFTIYLIIINKKIKSEKLKPVVNYIARYTYIFYLLHNFIIVKILEYITVQKNLLGVLVFYITIFIITLILSIIIKEAVINPISKLFDEIWKLIENKLQKKRCE